MMIRRDGRNVLRTPSLAETVMQPEGFPYAKQDLELAERKQPYRVAKAHWPTPRTRDHHAEGSGANEMARSPSLAKIAQRAWSTPRPCSGERSSGLNRTEIMRQWSTPTARDWKDGVLIANKTKTRSNLSRQAPRTNLDGNGSCASGLTLNPLFVEALMGWPVGWTDCASAVTGLSRWRRLMRCELSRLLRESTSTEPEQPCLF